MGQKILIVEDDLRLKLTYDMIFTKDGFTVLRATDGEEGLRIAEAENPDIILLDVMLPKLDGLGFLRKYDVKGTHPDAKIIVFSNKSDTETMRQAYELGATRFETKAMFSPKQLSELVRTTLATAAPAAPAAEKPADESPTS